MRKNSTDAERWLWQHLRNRELGRWKFRRQHPSGPFIVDFVCIEKKLIIEVDGGQHAEDRTKDTKRSQFLERKGFRILRFWNNEILREGEAVLNVVLSSLVKKPPHPNPLPSPLLWACAYRSPRG